MQRCTNEAHTSNTDIIENEETSSGFLIIWRFANTIHNLSAVVTTAAMSLCRYRVSESQPISFMLFLLFSSFHSPCSVLSFILPLFTHTQAHTLMHACTFSFPLTPLYTLSVLSPSLPPPPCCSLSLTHSLCLPHIHKQTRTLTDAHTDTYCSVCLHLPLAFIFCSPSLCHTSLSPLFSLSFSVCFSPSLIILPSLSTIQARL